MHALFTLFGRLHPVVVHFPVALLVVAALLALRSSIRREPLAEGVAPIVYLAALTAPLSAGMGFVLAGAESYHGRAASTLQYHQWAGVTTAILALVSALLVARRRPQLPLGALTLAALLAASLGVSITGHLGGQLVHGYDYLSGAFSSPEASTKEKMSAQPTSPRWRPLDFPPRRPKPTLLTGHTTDGTSLTPRKNDAPKTAEEALFFDQIQPLLERSCLKCHGADKSKGQLRLDKKRYAFKNPEVIVPGDSRNSLLYKLVSLPPDHEDFMPARGEPLSDGEIALLAQWIDEGAPWPDRAKP